MLLYEMLIASGIAVVLVVAAIDRLAARVMMGPEEMALLRLARAAEAQRRLVASAAQQEREARAAAAQRRLVALDARTRGTAPSASRYAHHSTRNTGRERLIADRGSSYARARDAVERRSWSHPQEPTGEEWWADVLADPLPGAITAREPGPSAAQPN
jgi:hypothetical protein